MIYGLVSAANFPISQTAMDSWSDTEAAHIVPGHAYLRGPLLARCSPNNVLRTQLLLLSTPPLYLTMNQLCCYNLPPCA